MIATLNPPEFTDSEMNRLETEAGVEFADVIEAEPAVVAGAVEARAGFTGRAKFTRLGAAGELAAVVRAADAAVESIGAQVPSFGLPHAARLVTREARRTPDDPADRS